MAAVVATVVKMWAQNGYAYAEIVAAPPLGGANVTAIVSTPTTDAAGNPLSNAQMQAGLQAAARFWYNGQFAAQIPLSNPGTITF